MGRGYEDITSGALGYFLILVSSLAIAIVIQLRKEKRKKKNTRIPPESGFHPGRKGDR